MRLPIYLNRTTRVNSIPRLSSSTRPCPAKAACKHYFCQVREMWVSKGAHLSSATVNTLPAVMIGTKPESAQFSVRPYVKQTSGSELLIDKGAEAFAEPGCLADLALLLLLPASPGEKRLTATL